MVGLALLLVLAIFYIKGNFFPQIFTLQFNGYALLSMVSFLGTLALLIKMGTDRNHSEEAVWYMLLMLATAIYAGGEMMQRLSATPAGALFWSQVSGFGATLIPVGIFLFAVAYTRPANIRPGLVIPVMIATSSILALFYSEGNLLFNNSLADMHLYPWGYNNDPGPAIIIPLLWVFTPCLLTIIMMLRFRHSSRDQLLRRQSLVYAIAFAAPVLLGFVTDGLLPAANLYIVPPLATLFELATIITIFYGISHYRLFQINPAILADNILKTMNEAVIVTRTDFTVEFTNKEAERLFGLSAEDISSGYIHRLFAPESWRKVHSYLAGETSERDAVGDVNIINGSGEHVPVRVFVSNLSEGDEYQALIFVISDITDITESYNKLETDATRIRKLLREAHNLQKQLAAEKASVEHTVDIRTRELRVAQESLRAADQLKTEFMLLSAHNMRTPITIMAGSLEMLTSGSKETNRKYFMDALEESIKRLRDFVEDMITITTLEAGTGLSMEPCTVESLVSPLVSEATAIADTKKSVNFRHSLKDTDVVIEANTLRLQSAVRNLINNAFKFTKSGHVALNVSRSGNEIVIKVVDTGIGIDMLEVEKLFTKFHRGTDTLRFEYEGEGIGLYLTKLIVAEHHGTITVDSTPGKGSTFTITVPIKASSA